MPRKKLDLSSPLETLLENESLAVSFRPRTTATKAVVEVGAPPAKPTRKPKAAPAEPKTRAKAPRTSAVPIELVAEAEDLSVALAFRSRSEDLPTEDPAPAAKARRRPSKSDLDMGALCAEFGIAFLQWREKSAGGAPTKAADEAPERGGRRRRGRERSRGDREGTQDMAVSETTESQAAEAVKVEPIKPVAKPMIPVPVDGPQVVLRQGIPTLVRNHRVYPPLLFFGGAIEENKLRNVFEEISMAGKAGIHLHSLILDLVVEPHSVAETAALAEKILKQAVEADPEAQIVYRVMFAAPANWKEAYPDAVYTRLDGKTAEPSLSSETFWSVARDCLHDLVSRLRASRLSDHILGVHLDRGQWFLPAGQGYDTSRAAKWKFRDWTRARYRNDIVSLRAAWFQSKAEFDKLEVPALQNDDDLAPDKFVRANRKDRPWVDYHLFLSDQTENRIAELAYAAKEASEGYFLVGVSYGYTFEWSHPASGHLSLGKMLRNPDIDFIAGPPSYQNREPGGAASFPGPIDSFALNGKLYLSEEDFKTSIGTGFQPDDFNPTVKTPQALESMHWRGVGAALVHSSAMSWMDLWGNGWLKTPSVWERAKVVADALVRRMAVPTRDPDVAIFIDERALAYLVDQKGFSLLVQNVRESVMRAGLSSAFYLLSDLQHRESFPESRLYVFLNAWDVRTELRAAIKNRLQKDQKVLFWLYTSGLFDSGRDSLERAREITGIALRPQPFHSRTGTTILNRRHPLCEAFPEKTSIGGARLEPSYFAIPEDGTVLGEYSQTGLPSFVLREFEPGDQENGWKSVFLGEPIVNAAMIRALAGIAGCHTWSFIDDVVHVRPPFLTVHCQGAGPRTIALPDKWSAYDLIEQQWVGGESTSLKFHATDGSTHCFLIGRRQEVEQILNADPTGLLHMEELPVRDENTVRFDSSSFDVPIMKLDEWMEGSEEEDISDDLLFKARIIDDEEPESEPVRVGRRRRNRKDRGRDRREGRREGERVNVDDLSMNVMFRKRD